MKHVDVAGNWNGNNYWQNGTVIFQAYLNIWVDTVCQFEKPIETLQYTKTDRVEFEESILFGLNHIKQHIKKKWG